MYNGPQLRMAPPTKERVPLETGKTFSDRHSDQVCYLVPGSRNAKAPTMCRTLRQEELSHLDANPLSSETHRGIQSLHWGAPTDEDI